MNTPPFHVLARQSEGADAWFAVLARSAPQGSRFNGAGFEVWSIELEPLEARYLKTVLEV